MINPINSNQYVSTVATSKNESKKDTKMDTHTNSQTDTVELGQNATASPTYQKPVTYKPNVSDVAKLMADADKATQSLRDLVNNLINRQGKTLDGILSGKETLVIDDKARADAQNLISEDGELGVKQTAQRIVDFAKAISGGDKAAIPELTNAIKKGFAEAEKTLGQLPDISKQTYDEVMKDLDAWSKEDQTDT